MTPIRVSPSSLKEGRWYEYLVRFLLGGGATVFTGLIRMLAFAVVFWSTVEKSALGAFAGASLAWLVVSLAAWYARRTMRLSGTDRVIPRSRPF
jgi:hypothetical protein